MKLTTLTGKDLLEAFKALDDELPAAAYKAIGGGKGERLGLTDIVPAYLPEKLLELFGPLGFGWTFGISKLESTLGKDRNGGDVWTANALVDVSYMAIYESGKEILSEKFSAPGGSDNSKREWAEKGAITNALGTAWFFAGYQLSVYKGLRGHEDFAEKPTLPAGKPAIKDTVKAAITAAKTSEPKITPEKFTEVAAALKDKGFEGSTPGEKNAAALKYVSERIGRKVTTLKDLFQFEADSVLSEVSAK